MKESMEKAETLRIRLRRTRQRIEELLGRFGASVTAYVTWPVWKDARCLFVLSTGRTGTTTLARLLGLSDEIEAFHEPSPQLLEERKTARWEVGENPGKYRHIFVRARGASLYRAVSKNHMYAETSPRLTFFAPVISELLPSAKFLFVHRDPFEVVRSGMKRGWYADHPADYARVRPVGGEDFYEKWEDASPLEKVCWYWTVCNTFAIRFCQRVDSSRVLTIQSEDLFGGAVVPNIFDFLGVEKPSEERVERVLKRKLNAQHEGTFPKREEWTSSMRKTLHRIAGETMARLGYSEGGIGTYREVPF